MAITHPVDRLHERLDKLSRRRRARGLPAPQVLLEAPGRRFEHGDQAVPFHAASIGKLLTATLVGMLADAGHLAPSTPLGALLPAHDLADLPVVPGVDAGRDITVEHLLAHTSGLPDYGEPPRRHDVAASVRGMVREPDRSWTPAALLAEAGTMRAVGRPGARFRYSDTGFVLLGRIVEEITGEPFAEAIRTRVFAPTGMDRAATPYDPTVAPSDLRTLEVAPFWIRGHELSTSRSVSVDWACGGVVAPPGDLVRFTRALHAGELVTAERLAWMTRARHRFRRGIDYGAGTMSLRLGRLFPGLGLTRLSPPVGHLGLMATHLFTYPEHDAHLVLNFHSTRAMNASFVTHARLARLLAGDAPS